MLLYSTIVIFQFPGLMLLAGALVKLCRANTRLHRLQVEGAAMIVVGMAARWLIFDPHFGIDRYEEQLWSYWFDRAEVGSFAIGLLFLMLAFFLERCPRPGLRPWSWAGKIVVVGGILGGTLLSLFAARHLGLAFFDVPYPESRLLFLLGLFPFCIGYLRTSLRHTDPSPMRMIPREEE